MADWSFRRSSRSAVCRTERGSRNQKDGGNKMSVVSMKQLLEAGVHFGHQTRRWNPKMAP
ncbi:MAG: 30S ribosomal protein S2, partial [Lachnospiraceae bacterium]|nr:30S ribosomal protein S2 [Lachnospiraceae bacterium]